MSRPSTSAKGPKRPYRKFRNTKCVVLPDDTVHPLTPERRGQGPVFDSLKEARHWVELLGRQRRGEITFLRRQVRIRVKAPDGRPICVYVADFTYMEAGRMRVVDVKSPMTKKLAIYRLKKRLLEVLNGIWIEEV